MFKQVLIALAGTVVLAGAAQAQQRPEQAIKYRKSVMTLMGSHFGRLGAMAQGRIPFDAAVAADNAQLVAMLAKLPFNSFGPGTDKGLPHRAKPEVWTETAKFKEAADAFQAEAPKLEAAAKTGNLDQFKAAFGAVGKTCKACHDTFQAEKDN
ncbi:cytochrome c [Pelomonas sp. SE-A7]|uniref:c-type cytochrome n=1 Tax=Pelomonas sp. SE-A7 TaxID=3054953 RepID=UPI00259CC078|nr:cytochrome c [Pelomonas sp. SE-A7]MDM4768122.1 cytochrome c [Pelomonas sp. SE-A7]